MKKFTFLSAAVLTAGIAGAYAQTNVGNPTPGTGVNPGLLGNYYGQPNTDSNANDIAYAAAHAPSATFTSTVVDYPAGQGGNLTNGSASDAITLNQFLGSDSASLSPSSVGSNNLNQQLIQFTGYIQLNAGNNYLEFGADDGGFVSIGGQTVINRDGNQGFGYTYGDAVANAAGLYPIVVDYHEEGGNTGVSFGLSDAANGNDGVVPNSQLFQSVSAVPEPSTWVAAGGLLLLAAGDFRRRLKA